MYNPFSLAHQIDPPSEEFEIGYDLVPAEFYPATAMHIQEMLGANKFPPTNLMSEFASAQNLGASAFDFVGKTYAETPESKREIRYKALEVCRRFMTEALHSALGYPRMYIHIQPDPVYRLNE